MDSNITKGLTIYTWEVELENLIEEMNAIYSLVIVNGNAKVAQIVHKDDKSRPTVNLLTIGGFKQLFSNTIINVGRDTSKRKSAYKYTTFASAWLDHPKRLSYPNGVEYRPYRKPIEGMLNTWIDVDVTCLTNKDVPAPTAISPTTKGFKDADRKNSSCTSKPSLDGYK